jgi:hypothetical protein
MTTDSSSALSERPVVRHKRVQRDCWFIISAVKEVADPSSALSKRLIQVHVQMVLRYHSNAWWCPKGPKKQFDEIIETEILALLSLKSR